MLKLGPGMIVSAPSAPPPMKCWSMLRPPRTVSSPAPPVKRCATVVRRQPPTHCTEFHGAIVRARPYDAPTARLRTDQKLHLVCSVVRSGRGVRVRLLLLRVQGRLPPAVRGVLEPGQDALLAGSGHRPRHRPPRGLLLLGHGRAPAD